MSFATADLSDAHGDAQVAEPVLRHFGGRRAFHGPVETLRVFEDNALVRAALEEPGAGRVLVVDGGGSLRCALLGDNLGAMAVANGWAAVVVHGCVRDTAQLAQMDLGVLALAAHPRRSVKRGAGERGGQLGFAGLSLRPGMHLYADEDGVLVAERELG
jgi:regulator of ribonuclease activity A